MVMIVEYSNTLEVDACDPESVILQVLSEFSQDIRDADTTLSTLDVDILVNSHSRLSEHDTTFDWCLKYSKRLCLRCIKDPTVHKYTFSPDSNVFVDGMVDWVVGPLVTTMIFATQEYIARFPPGPRKIDEN